MSEQTDALIAAQAAEIARLREILVPFARMASAIESAPNDKILISWDAGAIIVTATDVRWARFALAAPSPTAAQGAALLRIERAARRWNTGLIDAVELSDELDAALADYDAQKVTP